LSVAAVESSVASVETITTSQAKELSTLRETVMQLETKVSGLTMTVQALSTAMATLQQNPPATAAALGAADLEPVTTPDLRFNPVTDSSAYVPVSENETLINIFKTYRHRPAKEKPTIPEKNRLQVCVSLHQVLHLILTLYDARILCATLTGMS
jgi:hypothetical protein